MFSFFFSSSLLLRTLELFIPYWTLEIEKKLSQGRYLIPINSHACPQGYGDCIAFLLLLLLHTDFAREIFFLPPFPFHFILSLCLFFFLYTHIPTLLFFFFLIIGYVVDHGRKSRRYHEGLFFMYFTPFFF